MEGFFTCGENIRAVSLNKVLKLRKFKNGGILNRICNIQLSAQFYVHVTSLLVFTHMCGGFFWGGAVYGTFL